MLIQDMTPDSDWMRLQIAKLRMHAGDIAGASHILSTLKAPHNLPGNETLPLAALLRKESPAVARELLESIDPAYLATNAPIDSFLIAQEIGSERLRMALEPAFHAAAQAPDTRKVIFNTANDLIAIFQMGRETLENHRKQWLQGQTPLHLIVDHEPEAFLAVCLGRGPTDESWNMTWPMLLRAAMKQRPDTAFSGAPVHLDITAIAIGQRLGILEKLERLGPVRVPITLPDALTGLIQSFDSDHKTAILTIEALLGRIESGELELIDQAADGRLLLELPLGRDRSPTPGFVAFAAKAAKGRPSKLREWLREFSFDQQSGDPDAGQFVITVDTALWLERSGMLGETCAVADAAILSTDRDQLSGVLAHHKRQLARRQILMEARDFIAQRLVGEHWSQLVPTRLIRENPEILKEAGPILKCLFTLVQDHEGPEAVTWIEDRAASTAAKIGNSRRVDVLDVLFALERAGHMTRLEVQTAEQELAAMGYGSLPYDPEHVLSLVYAAPVRRQRLIETEALALLRRHFSLQFDRLRYSNPSLPIDGGLGELRFGVWHMHLAVPLLVELWSDEQMSNDQLIPRAGWIWDNLSVDQAGFLPIQGTSDNAIRRTLVRSSLSGLISAGFQLRKDSSATESDCRERYYSWAYNNVAAPVFEHDPRMQVEVVDEIARTFLLVLQRDENLVAPGMQQIRRVLILRAIHPMPEPLRSQILRVPEVSEALELKSSTTIFVTEDVKFDGSGFFDAVTQAFADGSAALETLTGRTATLTSAENQITIDLEGQLLVLADGDLGLASVDREVRRGTYDKVVRELDLAAYEVDAFWHLLENQSVRARFESLHAREDQSYLHRLQRLTDELEGERQFDIDILSPPSPEVLLSYLRLPPDCTEDLLPTAFETLEAEFDIFEAIRRTSGLPIVLDTETEARLADAILTLPDSGEGHAPSPLYGLKTALALKNATPQRAARAIDDLLDALEQQSGLFVAVVRWSTRRVRHTPEWTRLSLVMQETLLWLHADQIVARLLMGRVDAERCRKLFQDRDTQGVWDLLSAGIDAGPEPGFETPIGLQAWILGLLCRNSKDLNLPKKTIKRMRALVAQENQGVWQPQLILLARPDRPPFGTTADTLHALLEAHLLTATTFANCGTPATLIDRLLLEAPLTETAEVAGLLPMFRICDIQVDKVEQLQAVVARYDPFSRYTASSPLFEVWLVCCSMLYGRIDDRSGYVAFLEGLAKSMQTQTKDPLNTKPNLLIAPVINFAVAHDGNTANRLDVLIDTLDQLVTAMPNLAPNLRDLLSLLAQQTPAEHGAGLWDALLKWRRV